jgi:flagellar protein FliO/FliZ
MKGLFSLKTIITRVFPFMLAAFGLGLKSAVAEGEWAPDELAPNEFMPTEEPLTLRGDSTELWAGFFQVIIVLIIIIGLILIMVKLLSQKNRFWLGNRTVRPLGGVQLGQNKSLQLVEIGRSIYVIGVGENVNLLQRIDDEEEVRLVLESLAGPSDSRTGGKGWMWLKERFGLGESEPEHPTASFQEIFHEKMKKVSGRDRKIADLLAGSDQDGDEQRR